MFSISYIEEGGADMQRKSLFIFCITGGAFQIITMIYKYQQLSVTRAEMINHHMITLLLIRPQELL